MSLASKLLLSSSGGSVSFEEYVKQGITCEMVLAYWRENPALASVLGQHLQIYKTKIESSKVVLTSDQRSILAKISIAKQVDFYKFASPNRRKNLTPFDLNSNLMINGMTIVYEECEEKDHNGKFHYSYQSNTMTIKARDGYPMLTKSHGTILSSWLGPSFAVEVFPYSSKQMTVAKWLIANFKIVRKTQQTLDSTKVFYTVEAVTNRKSFFHSYSLHLYNTQGIKLEVGEIVATEMMKYIDEISLIWTDTHRSPGAFYRVASLSDEICSFYFVEARPFEGGIHLRKDKSDPCGVGIIRNRPTLNTSFNGVPINKEMDIGVMAKLFGEMKSQYPSGAFRTASKDFDLVATLPPGISTANKHKIIFAEMEPELKTVYAGCSPGRSIPLVDKTFSQVQKYDPKPSTQKDLKWIKSSYFSASVDYDDEWAKAAQELGMDSEVETIASNFFNPHDVLKNQVEQIKPVVKEVPVFKARVVPTPEIKQKELAKPVNFISDMYFTQSVNKGEATEHIIKTMLLARGFANKVLVDVGVAKWDQSTGRSNLIGKKWYNKTNWMLKSFLPNTDAGYKAYQCIPTPYWIMRPGRLTSTEVFLTNIDLTKSKFELRWQVKTPDLALSVIKELWLNTIRMVEYKVMSFHVPGFKITKGEMFKKFKRVFALEASDYPKFVAPDMDATEDIERLLSALCDVQLDEDLLTDDAQYDDVDLVEDHVNEFEDVVDIGEEDNNN